MPRKLLKGVNYSREETIRGNMVSVCVSLRFSRLILLEIYIYLRETSSSSNLHSCIQSQDCRPLQNIVKYYTKCMNPMKRMEQSRNVEKALDCDKNTYTAGWKWNVWGEWFLAWNQGNHQNFEKNDISYETQGFLH